MSKLSDSQVIALTGTMGSGKSTVTNMLGRIMPVTDCDRINARLLQKDQAGYTALKDAGLLALDEQGEIDKPAQAARMFSDPDYRKRVENILHPLIRQEVRNWVEAQDSLCAVEVPLLFESGMNTDFPEIWCVVCSLETALTRLQQGRNISRAQAMERIEKQMDVRQKCERSDAILYNDGSLEELQKQVNALLESRLKQKV